MPLSRRYSPEWSPLDYGLIGMDFSTIIPPGVRLVQAGVAPRLEIFTNLAQPVQVGGWVLGSGMLPNGDWTVENVVPGVPTGVIIRGRAVAAFIGGGVAGVDYQMRWTVIDAFGQSWQRTGLLLVALTS